MEKTRSITLHPGRAAEAGPAHGLLALRSGHQLVPHDRPDRETANGYLRLTAHILLQAKERPFRTIGVLSAREGEGRTTAAVNLAICLGRTQGLQGRILLVDGDGRKRAVTKLFCGDDPLRAGADRPQFVRTQFEGVDLKTAPDSADDLTLHDPTAWIDSFMELGDRYTHIVIDCPPILDVPEGMILRDCVEELVLVVRAGETPLAAVTEAIGSLKHRVLGVVLNGSRPHGRQTNKVTA